MKGYFDTILKQLRHRRILCLIPLVILLILMALIFRYVHLYADDFYYSRDIKYGFFSVPYVLRKNFEANGRVWVHFLLMLITRYDALIFRIINPIVITLSAALIARTAGIGKNKSRVSVFAFILCACYFIGLHIQVADTTIYYAACSLNYLYPAAVTILYGALFTKRVLSGDADKLSPLLLITAFFAASSTQQCGAAAIGYAVMLTLYAVFVKKQKLRRRFWFNYLPLILGFSIVMYGSVMRYIRESSDEKAGGIVTNLARLIRLNVFSKPVFLFTLVMLLCIIAGLVCLLKVHKGTCLEKLDRFLLVLMLVLSVKYVIVMLSDDYDISSNITDSGIIITEQFFFAICFTILYLFCIIYISIVIMLRKDSPLVLCSVIDSIGAQLIIIFVDAKYTSAYKMILPSQLFLLTFAAYVINSVFTEKHSKAAVIPAVIITGSLCAVSMCIFCSNYKGYKQVSENIQYNLDEIDSYLKNGSKDDLVFRKVISDKYGYNNGNWNNMPGFMRECYGIRSNTKIEYEI